MFIYSLNLIFTIILQLHGIHCSHVSHIDILLENITRQEEYLLNAAAESDESFFGVLHTQDAFRKWLEKEDEIVEVLEKRLELIDEEIMLIEEYLEDYDESTGEAMRNLREPKETPEERGRVVGSSAVLGHRMVSRYAGIISQIRTFLTCEDFLENEEKLAKILEETREFVYDEATNTTKRLAPGAEDLFLSMSSFFHVQKIYGYRPNQLMYGFNPNNSKDPDAPRLSALECAEMGTFGLFRKEYQNSVEWLELAANLLAEWRDEEDENLPLNVVAALLTVAIQEHNRKIQIPEIKTDGDLHLNFYHKPITTLQTRIPIRDLVFKKQPGLAPNASTAGQLMDLCMGNDPQPPELRKKFKCYYERKKHPYLYINPVKVEHLSDDPPVFQLYEMIGNKTINRLRKMYGGKVHPTKISGYEGENIPNWKTGAYKVLLPSEVPSKMFDLPTAVTGMKTRNNVEMFQYVEYTEGRWSREHPDTLKTQTQYTTPADGVSPHDDWAATIHFYLETPKIGGQTVYCQGGTQSNPVRGSAMLWYNMYRNGTLRSDIHHAVCPVLEGHKITMNRWIRYLDNWNNFQCKLNQFE